MHKVDQPAGLISVLLNNKLEFGDRDDAAMDLSEFDDPNAEDALFKVASDPLSDEDLAQRCGESLAIIWCRKSVVNREALNMVQKSAHEIAIAVIKARNPALLIE